MAEECSHGRHRRMMTADLDKVNQQGASLTREEVSAVLCQDVWMRFGAAYALVGVTARFERATPTIISGPNASGKSTLLSIVAGLLRPSEGSVLFFGSQGPLARDKIRDKLSFFGQGAVVYQDMPAADNLLFHARVCGLTSPMAHSRSLLEEMGIDWQDPKPCGQMSHGQRRRVGLARALLTDPEILLLDEPDSGLDRASRIRLAQLLMRKAQRAVVVVASHDELLCAHMDAQVIELDDGRVKTADTSSSRQGKQGTGDVPGAGH